MLAGSATISETAIQRTSDVGSLFLSLIEEARRSVEMPSDVSYMLRVTVIPLPEAIELWPCPAPGGVEFVPDPRIEQLRDLLSNALKIAENLDAVGQSAPISGGVHREATKLIAYIRREAEDLSTS